MTKHEISEALADSAFRKTCQEQRITEEQLFNTPPDELTPAELDAYTNKLRSFRIVPAAKKKSVSKKKKELDELKAMLDGED